MTELINIKSISDIIKIKTDTINTRNTIIQNALNNGLHMLHLDEFASVVKFTINRSISLNMLWDVFQRDIPVYITDELVKLFGYKGELKLQKRNLLKLVKKYNISVIQLTNEEYVKFTGSPENTRNSTENKDDDLSGLYPEITKSQLKSRPIHTLIMPRDLKKLLLVVDTDNGDNARNYMINLDELFQLYMTYQKEYEKNMRLITERYFKEEKERHEQTMRALDEIKETLDVTQETLTEMNSKFERATDERVPRTNDAAKHESFVLLKLNKANFQWLYYVLRCQTTVIKRTIRKMRTKYPQQVVLMNISYQPNSKNLFNLVKENLGATIVVKNNYIKLTNQYTESQFLQDIRDLNDAKKEVDTDEDTNATSEDE